MRFYTQKSPIIFPVPSEPSPHCLEQLELARLFRVVEKRFWFTFALRERSDLRAGVLFSVHSRRGWFFLFVCFLRARARALVSASRWIFKRIWQKARFSIRAQTALCASVLCATGSTCSSHLFLRRNKMIFHLNNMLTHIFDYIVVKCHSCCSWRIHEVSANTKATGNINCL